MGILEFLVATIPVVMVFSIPLYAISRTFNQKDKKLELRELEEKKELERLKQENYILENKQMQIELDKLKKEREERALSDSKKDRWLIEETRKEERF
ncbi:hypothetical protein WN59_07235 [Salinicoccus sediminis]|uniref:Uncharacterized protein n=1 Tax=Salinicoccus sediminis TaxID=1432562 RepID=A0A0M2SIJ9_9STAP|nr:hypothetical protein [Salinicoccus sediminis]KKK34514.1 hypothetical protein WN59_07235 [Salinicoccus sediminis]